MRPQTFSQMGWEMSNYDCESAAKLLIRRLLRTSLTDDNAVRCCYEALTKAYLTGISVATRRLTEHEGGDE